MNGLCGDCYGGSTPDEFADIECCCCGAPCVTHDDCESCNETDRTEDWSGGFAKNH